MIAVRQGSIITDKERGILLTEQTNRHRCMERNTFEMDFLFSENFAVAFSTLINCHWVGFFRGQVLNCLQWVCFGSKLGAV